MSSLVTRHLDAIRRSILKSKSGIECVACVFVLCGLGGGIIPNIVGIVYPAYCTILAIESDGSYASTSTDETHIEWLIYWIVYAGFIVLEHFIDAVIFWVPFFYPLKLSFLIWCSSPEYKGANTIYVALVPFLRPRDYCQISPVPSAASLERR